MAGVKRDVQRRIDILASPGKQESGPPMGSKCKRKWWQYWLFWGIAGNDVCFDVQISTPSYRGGLPSYRSTFVGVQRAIRGFQRILYGSEPAHLVGPCRAFGWDGWWHRDLCCGLETMATPAEDVIRKGRRHVVTTKLNESRHLMGTSLED